jgi:hypothetical protein
MKRFLLIVPALLGLLAFVPASSTLAAGDGPMCAYKDNLDPQINTVAAVWGRPGTQADLACAQMGSTTSAFTLLKAVDPRSYGWKQLCQDDYVDGTSSAVFVAGDSYPSEQLNAQGICAEFARTSTPGSGWTFHR